MSKVICLVSIISIQHFLTEIFKKIVFYYFFWISKITHFLMIMSSGVLGASVALTGSTWCYPPEMMFTPWKIGLGELDHAEMCTGVTQLK